jgi:chemotaxis signal transduction protein
MPNPDTHRSQRFCVFEIADCLCGVEMSSSIETISQPNITEIPQSPSWLLGVSNLHGEILTIIALNHFLGKPPRSLDQKSKVLVLHDSPWTFGVPVQGASSKILDIEYLKPHPDSISHPVFAHQTTHDSDVIHILSLPALREQVHSQLQFQIER